MIPLGTDRPLRRPTLVNHGLIAVNVLVYLVQATVGGRHVVDPEAGPRIFEQFVLTPGHSPWWTYVTYAFLHGGFMHILGNMLTLLVFGPCVEDRFGRLGYLLFYLVGGASAGLLHAAFQPNPVLGASGAIAAVTGAFLVLFPRTHVKCLFFLGVIGLYQIPAVWFIAIRIAYDIFSVGTGRSGNVATLAHLGGYGFGASLAFVLLGTRVLAREPYDLFSIARQAARRRQFRELALQHEQSIRRGEPPAYAIRGAKRDQQTAEAIAQARADIATRVGERDLSGAASVYRALIEKHGTDPGIALMNRNTQYALANHLLQAGDHGLAFAAYDLFARGYPTDPEIPMVRLTLGLVLTRYLNDPVRAKQEINAALPDLPEGTSRELAKELLTELG